MERDEVERRVAAAVDAVNNMSPEQRELARNAGLLDPRFDGVVVKAANDAEPLDRHLTIDDLKKVYRTTEAYTHTALVPPEREADVTKAIEQIEDAHVRIIASRNVPEGQMFMMNDGVFEEILSRTLNDDLIHFNVFEAYEVRADVRSVISDEMLRRFVETDRIFKFTGITY